MHSFATLLLRDAFPSKKSLTTLVEDAQHRPHIDQIHSIHIETDCICLQPSTTPQTTATANVDEGFESDAESLLSTDSTNQTKQQKQQTTPQTTPSSLHQSEDSANGSSSDEEPQSLTAHPSETVESSESFKLRACVCYTDATYRDIVILVVRETVTLVFRFGTLSSLERFYKQFVALKAIADSVHHLNLYAKKTTPTTEDNYYVDSDSFQVRRTIKREFVGKKEPISELRKVWSSADNLIETKENNNASQSDKTIARRAPLRRNKPRAPPPPTLSIPAPSTIAKSKIHPQPAIHEFVASPSLLPPKPLKSPVNTNYNQNTLQNGRNAMFTVTTLPRKRIFWMIPNLQVSKNVPKRVFERQNPRQPPPPPPPPPLPPQPMAYRYVDTAPSIRRAGNCSPKFNGGLSERLFGLSSKMVRGDVWRKNLCRETPPVSGSATNLCLKGVIKNNHEKCNRNEKEMDCLWDERFLVPKSAGKKNEKKVTFSAYNTVQVV